MKSTNKNIKKNLLNSILYSYLSKPLTFTGLDHTVFLPLAFSWTTRWESGLRADAVRVSEQSKAWQRVWWEWKNTERERERNKTLSFQELNSKPKPESSLKHGIFCYCISLLGFSIVVFLGSFLWSVFYAHKVFDEMSVCTLRSFLFNFCLLAKKTEENKIWVLILFVLWLSIAQYNTTLLVYRVYTHSHMNKWLINVVMGFVPN